MPRIYDLQRWKAELRPAYLAAHAICQHCAERGSVRAGHHVDHIQPISKGGDPWDWHNLQTLCQDCHNRKTAEDEGKQPKLGCDVDGIPLARKSKRGRG